MSDERRRGDGTEGTDRPAGPPETAIEFDGVTVYLGGSCVLDAVDATVEAGRFVGLVGPNGAGKTTLLRTANGGIDPDEGSVSVGGQSIAGRSSKAVGRLVATVPQRTELAFSFPVRDVVEMGRFPHRSRLSIADSGADRVEWAMERTGIVHLADRPVTETSGGERQRVLLARALAQDTPLLLLDEPTASLDVNHQVRTLDLVRNLVDREGRTVLAAIHDLDLAARFCDELILLAGGRVRATGTPESVLTPGTLEAAFDTPATVGRNPATGTPTVTALPAQSRGEDDDFATERIHVVGGGGRATSILRRLVGGGYSVSLGVVHEDDPDAEVAAALGVETVTVPPFSAVDRRLEETIDLARAADVTVLADVDLGPSNAANLGVAEAADRLVVVEGRPLAERNHVDGATAERFGALLERARLVDERTVLDAVAEAVETERAVAADGGG